MSETASETQIPRYVTLDFQPSLTIFFVIKSINFNLLFVIIGVMNYDTKCSIEEVDNRL